jgi:CheY-like chemotaxis protein
VSRRRLLLADDSVTIQKVVNLTFADEGIEVIAVGDGNDALDRLLEISPDLVMADVNMPGLNGYQVCERIKQTEKFKNTPVILLVGSFEPFDEAEAQRVGADDYLTKPFQSIRQLVNKVTDLLESAGNNQTQAAAATDSFEKTAEMPRPDLNEPETSAPPPSFSEASQYGDAGMDDEMIQTSPSAAFPFDEAQKFISRDYVEEMPDPDFGKTQPLSVADLQEINARHADSQASQSEEIAPAETVADEIAIDETGRDEIFSTTGRVSLELDDDDLLELPSFDDELEEEPEVSEPPAEVAHAQTAAAAETSAEDQQSQPAAASENIQPDVSQSENEVMAASAAVGASSQLSPEMIDAIAQRVIEKLSDRTVKEIAWEVVPQHADLIIKKMVEEKLKE